MLANLVTFELCDPIKAEVVFSRFDFGNQIALQCFKASTINLALENRFLYSLTDAFAQLGNAPQASTAFSSLGIDVVADDYQHDQRTK